jgi:MFS family permease
MACCGAHGVQDGLTATVYVLLPVIGQQFGLSYASIGIIRAAHTTAMSLLEYPSGVLSERLGAARLLAFGLICSGTGYLALGASVGFLSLLAALFLAGVGGAFQHSLSSSLVSGAFDGPARRVALGTYNASGDVGKLAATGAMSALLGLGLGWQIVTTGYGIIALLAGLGVLALLARAVPVRARERSAAGVDGISERRGFVALLAIVFLDTAVQDGFLIFVAFLMLEKQLPAELAAFAVVLTLLGGVAGKFACGMLAARLGVIRSLVVVECLTAAGIAAVCVAPTMIAFLLLPLLGIVLQGSSSITYGSVGEFVDHGRSARAFGVVYTVTSMAGIVAPITIGVLSDAAGVRVAFVAMALAVLLPLPLCLVLQPALRRARS